jgi:hypothetical protein
MRPSITEFDSGANHEVLHRGGDEDFPGLRKPSNTRTDVNGNAGQIIVAELTLSGVEPTADLDPNPARLFTDGSSTSDGATWPVERGEKSVTESLDFAAAEALNLLPCQTVVTIQEIAPGVVPESRGSLGRAHDVGEEHGGQYAIDLMIAPCACEELLYEIHGLVLVTGTSTEVEIAGELDERGVGNVLSGIAGSLDGRDVVAASVYHEGWGTDG